MTNLEKLLIFEEGIKLRPYRCSKAKATWGVGRNFQDKPFSLAEREYLGMTPEDGWTSDKVWVWLDAHPATLEQVLWMLRRDVADATINVVRALPWVRGLNEARQAALVSMAFQMGLGKANWSHGLLGFPGMLGALQREDWAAGKAEALDSQWAKKDTPERAKRHAEMLLTGEWPADLDRLAQREIDAAERIA